MVSEKVMEMPVRNRLIALLGKKQAEEGRMINLTTLAAETNLSRTTLSMYVQNETTRFDASTIQTLCQYFNCQVGDLLYLDDMPRHKEPVS